MFIKANVRGGYRAAAKYLASQGQNEFTRLVHISDPDAKNLDEAFHNMWLTASSTKAEKPLFHFSINPFKDERMTDAQVKRVAEAYAAKCSMDIKNHQHVIVEHIKDGRQHFHVILNRVSEKTDKAIDPGLYKKKAKECAREMEIELGLKRLTPKTGVGTKTRYGGTRKPTSSVNKPKSLKVAARFNGRLASVLRPRLILSAPSETFRQAAMRLAERRSKNVNEPRRPIKDQAQQKYFELLEWAWANHRLDILRDFGIILPIGFFDP